MHTKIRMRTLRKPPCRSRGYRRETRCRPHLYACPKRLVTQHTRARTHKHTYTYTLPRTCKHTHRCTIPHFHAHTHTQTNIRARAQTYTCSPRVDAALMHQHSNTIALHLKTHVPMWADFLGRPRPSCIVTSFFLFLYSSHVISPSLQGGRAAVEGGLRPEPQASDSARWGRGA